MARPKKGTKAGDLANKKWRKTVEERYGSVTEMARRMGRLGGLAGKGPDYKGGFASNPALASVAGAKGGRTSRRNKNIQLKIKNNEEEIIKLLELGVPMSRIAETFEISDHSLRYWVRKRRGV